ncbi:hypothetical protein S40288_11590 [Stachybotrys chartarum IBT 40288]|nr:hypothetical protein S40288_11590 [Stachybotrys chartarum IBT 40288]
MMGDREKCIQAQMDEYLSKPLQQNHLIQTIMKCATLGGQLLEKNRERELAQVYAKSSSRDGGTHGYLRPGLETRSFTTREPMTTTTALDSPLIMATDDEDPLSRTRHDLSELRSNTS